MVIGELLSCEIFYSATVSLKSRNSHRYYRSRTQTPNDSPNYFLFVRIDGYGILPKWRSDYAEWHRWEYFRACSIGIREPQPPRLF